MARIAFILLAHKEPEAVIQQARRLTATGDYVAIHFDGRSKAADFAMISTALADNPSVVFARRRHKCGWGEWSLVAATLEALRAANGAFPLATHFYMLSGDCMPIKSAEEAHEFLDGQNCDFIESFDFFASDWIKTGIKEERLSRYHLFNERKRKRLFYASLALQRRLNIHRSPPADIRMMIGSQWWCLRRLTIEQVLNFCDTRPDAMRFFSTTWIPDETFFQTVVRHVVPRNQIRSRTLTFLMFTDYGMPVTFYNDHYDLLVSQDYMFARKISPEATGLKERLGALWQAKGKRFARSTEGPGLFRFLTGRGRVGRRFAPRFWEGDTGLGRRNVLHVIVAKKWHLAKRLTQAIRDRTDIPAVDYLFNEDQASLPDLGGAETTLAKRQRHRRALLRLLFDQFESRRMVICLDPSALPLLSDFTADRAATRILLIDSEFDDDYVRGHIGRVGLAGQHTSAELIERILPTVRADLEDEVERLRDMDFAHFQTISRAQGQAGNAVALAAFLDVPPEIAQELAETPHLLDD
ncbi:beta-1,6-N-acetylglucosaminyltransferase [Paracoccus sp. M683]|uniref:DUF5928 domain-containing protein n=1 Tax=Paracoccus sp. M683 TaxID=2594268 RepID=UPI00117C9C83|nr:DUF5928 domain-containing protein [Paracoccus sp. M683]TRW98142.1 beta-1,6-N-acetylglucosaminyltransferase [Paracoccus sp. M683]